MWMALRRTLTAIAYTPGMGWDRRWSVQSGAARKDEQAQPALANRHAVIEVPRPGSAPAVW
jgi:hypothetical protein